MLSDMKIGSRLTALLTLLLAMLLLVGGMSIYMLAEANSKMESMYQDRLVAVDALHRINELNLVIRTALAGSYVTPEIANKNKEEIAESIAEIGKYWDVFLATHATPEQVELANKVVAARKKYRDEGIAPAIAAMKIGDMAQLKKLIVEDVRPLYENLTAAIVPLRESEINESKKLFEDSAASYRTFRSVLIAMIACGVLLAVLLGLSIIRGINRSVTELRGVMVKMSTDGDLSARVKIVGRDEIAQAAIAFNGLIEGFANIIRQVLANADTVSSTAAQLSASSLQIAQGSQLQSEAAASTAAAVEQITVSISAVAANTDEVRKQSEKSLHRTQQGNQDVTVMIGEIGRVQDAVNQIAGSVKEFVDSTRAISGMTQQVKDIADQTNLLALNAAIEAARAGEQGRGFAVVADEVRKLAEKSARSASEIDQVTNSLNQKSSHVEAVVQTGLRSLQATQEQVARVSAVLSEAGEAVLQSSHGVSDIAASVGEQSLASTEIARNVEKIAQMSEESHAATESNTQDIARLEQLAKTLQTAVSRFRV
ncbi:MAG: methyl-accepting chemotaxis protein [Gallionella sp.]|nr:methyl-accepting chemotaxis protein [Gallionella sp.]